MAKPTPKSGSTLTIWSIRAHGRWWAPIGRRYPRGRRRALHARHSSIWRAGLDRRADRRSRVLGTMAVWWRDVIREATFEGHHTPVVQIGLRYGMALFIASEVMFFAAFFWAYFRCSPVSERGDRRRLAAAGHPAVRSVRIAAAQHADPAASGVTVDLGAPRVDREGPAAPDSRPRDLRWCSASASHRCRPTSTATPPLASPTGSILRPFSWRPGSTAST